MTGGPSLTYVYAVAAADPRLAGQLAALRGVGDAPVTLLSPRTAPSGPAFVISRVPADQWGEEALRSRFEDLAWLEETARAHHHVIQVLMEDTVVLPLRLATLYQNDDRALEALREEQDAFAARLALLARHTEYGVKIYVVPEEESSDAPAGSRAQPAVSPAAAESSPGKAYLQARRAQRHAREDRYLQARQAADRIAAAAARHATQSVVRHPAQTGPLTRRENGENVLNDSYLVPDDQAEDFRTALQDAGQDLPGIRIEVTGPWAPYSFATLAAQPGAPPLDQPTDQPPEQPAPPTAALTDEPTDQPTETDSPGARS